MKPTGAIQEILLFTGTNFSNRELSDLSNYKEPGKKPQIVEFEQAFRAGIVFEMLPELSSLVTGSKAFIWDIYSTSHFVLITQGTQPQQIEDIFSVDPHFFLAAAVFN